ncbi:2'-5' RNA ligase family protein [Streptomyces sp. NPDC048550]|uniref:2'-5' RNA ligase family protein n=1 Tax=unclassified Streptomyces TaxID=2593676 RepID=UPI0022538D55|nr:MULTISPECIES: 2'-5' RNA ligase family protein [unclassified Streptomyces]MCX5147171.1 2'-5' RNA ligase family protein [Streptomyces sp. NBC_00320]WSN50329.1 2'-5' RNA ligase family protein [Streptomyces sp. NBC_01296]WSW60229.1 2'-5' RNA ligase family protein [Streptomyces sp. NBC_00998]
MATDTTHDTGQYEAGQTGLIVKVPEAEPAVRAWRERLDPSAAAGIPAHVTVLFPFLEERLIDAAVHAALTETVGAHRAFDVRFAESRRFPEVLYLAPEPDTELRLLTRAITARWPQAQPYGGRFPDVIPHLTVAQRQEADVLAEIEADLTRSLPLTTRVSSVDLMVHDGTAWRDRASFALRG